MQSPCWQEVARIDDMPRSIIMPKLHGRDETDMSNKDRIDIVQNADAGGAASMVGA